MSKRSERKRHKSESEWLDSKLLLCADDAVLIITRPRVAGIDHHSKVIW